MLTPSQKGSIAEAAIVAAAIKLGISSRTVSLRLGPTQNNQEKGINWAEQYEFGATLGSRGAIAQLGERLLGMQKVAGSSPAGSTDLQLFG